MSKAAERRREIVLVRHAAATGQGADAELTSEGRLQAAALSDLLPQLGVERVISSPFRRAIESAEPFCAREGLRVETDDRLAERVLSLRNLPDWREHLRRSFDELDYRLDGESSRVAQARGVAVLCAAVASGQRCVLVTHGNLLALILKWADGTVGYEQWSRLSNPDVFVLQVEDGRPKGFRRVWQVD